MLSVYEYFFYPLLIALIIVVVRHFLFKERNKKNEYNRAADKFRSSFSSALHSLKYEDAGIKTTCKFMQRDIEEQKKAKAEFEQHLTEKERKELDNYWRLWLRPHQFIAQNQNQIEDMRKLGIRYIEIFLGIAKRK